MNARRNIPIMQGIPLLLVGLYWILFGIVSIVHLANESLIYTCLFILLSIFGAVALYMAARRVVIEQHDRLWLWLLVVVCLLVKGIWVLTFPTEPRADYLTFYRTAQMLAEQWTIDFHYVSLFPHIMGYASFLSFFFALFGASVTVAVLVNAVLSTVSMVFIYLISDRLWGRRAAFIAALFWIGLPSQTIYNALVLSEPLYTTLILGLWLLLIRITDRWDGWTWTRLLAAAAVVSILLGWIDAVRPLALILYIAMIIWMVLANIRTDTGMKVRVATFLLVIGIGLWGMGQLTSLYNQSRLGEEIASTVGYNIYVGFNVESRGKWNQADSDHLYAYVDGHPEWTADDVQQQMLQDAKERILAGEIPFIRLFYDKIHLLWGEDAMAYTYSDLPREHERMFVHASNAFYFFMMICSVYGLFAVVREDLDSFAIMLCLFVLGLTAAHLLSEVAYRYHYAGTAVMAILAGAGISAGNVWRRRKDQGKRHIRA